MTTPAGEAARARRDLATIDVTSAMLVASDLTVAYGSSFRAVDTVSFSVEAGSTLALVGESGAGKTTLALALPRLLPAEAQVSGDVCLAGCSVFAMAEAELREVRRRQISVVFQDPVGSLVPGVRVGRQIIRVVAHRMAIRDETEATETARRLLREVGLADVGRLWNAYPRELSGGMCQRVMLALALATEPRLVIADEPLSALDAVSQVGVLRLLLELQQKLRFAMLYVTHDLRVAAHFEQIGVLKAGQLVELGPAQKILTDPSAAYTRELVAAARALSMP